MYPNTETRAHRKLAYDVHTSRALQKRARLRAGKHSTRTHTQHTMRGTAHHMIYTLGAFDVLGGSIDTLRLHEHTHGRTQHRFHAHDY